MNPFTKRNLSIPVCIILFVGFLYSFNKLLPVLGSHIQHLEMIAISLIILISIVVMLFWSILGVFGGLASFLTAMIFLYRPITDLDPYYYSVLIMAFFLSSIVGYSISKKINISNQEYIITVEKVNEDTNLIENHMKNRDAEVSAMGDKISSLLKLKNIADSLSLSMSTDEIIKIVSEETFSIFKDKCRVLLFTVDTSRMELNLSYAVKEDKRKTFTTKNGGIFDKWVLKNMKSLLVKDVSKDFRFSLSDEEKKDDAIALIINPMIVESNVLGILRVDSTDEAAFAQYELRILDIIGGLAAVALENARLYRQTEELAIKDSLTGLYVHRYFMERFDAEVKRAYRSDSIFALIMFDIDNFKDFNDQHGHTSGDVVLRNIGKILRSKAASGDIVARYGGEEFAFLALNYDKEKAIALSNEIREEIQNTPVTIRREKCTVTMSAGIAVFPKDAKLREDIIWEADKCLYEAKAKGKNRVCAK